EQEVESDKRKLEMDMQEKHQRAILRQGQLEHELQRLQEHLSQDELWEQQTGDAVAQAERRMQQQHHQSERIKQEENHAMQESVGKEKMLEAQNRRMQDLRQRLKDLDLQQKILSDKEEQMRIDQMERQEQEQEVESDKRKLEMDMQEKHQRAILRQGQLEHELQRLQEHLSQDELREQQTGDAVAQAERRMQQQHHQSELIKQEENHAMQESVDKEKMLEAQNRRMQDLRQRLKDLDLQQKILSDKEEQMRIDQMERQEQVLRKRQEQQLRQCQLQLQDMRNQQEASDQHFRSKLERMNRDLELQTQRVKELQAQLLRIYEVEAGGKEDALQQRLVEKKVQELEKELAKIREELLQQSAFMTQQEQNVRDQEEQLAQLQLEALREIQEHLDKPRERGPDGEELADSKALRRKLQSDKEELEKQMALQEQHQSLRAEQQQRVVQRLGDQLQVLLGLLDGLRVKPVMTASGRQELKQEAFSLVQEREEWLQQLQEIEERQRVLYVEEQQRMEFFEETAEHWKLEQQALLKQEELAEAAARDAERQAMEEAARHLAEGKLVPGANLEVILADPGPVGLTFYADDTAPPRVRKVKKDRRAFWEKHGMQDGAAILAVGDTPTAHLTSADLLPLLNSRPLRLQFDLSGPPDDGLNALDDSGQTALHRALEEGDEAKALEILANPEFQSINVQDNLGKTALHWAASGGMENACKAILSHPDFHEEDAADYRGTTAFEDAEGAGHMQVVKAFDDHRVEATTEQEGW
ncbi:unnamed protein product, partial [Effrenium voratum]